MSSAKTPGATRRWRTAIAQAVVLALFASAGCGPSDRGATRAGSEQPVAKIVVLAPLSGALASQGVGIRNAVDMAVRQANQRQAVPGWRLASVAQDDAATPESGAQAASTVSSDPAVVGVVGPLNSDVAQEVQPILDGADIVTISPGNTNDTLTRGVRYQDHPVRPHGNYFRVATIDSLQGKFAADYAYHRVGARNVAVVHDKKTYGKGLAETFSQRFTQDGGLIGSIQEVNSGDKDFSGILAVLAPLHPDLVFYGGEFPEAALISKQAKQLGLTVPLMGGDGIKDNTYIAIAGRASEGDLASAVGAPAETLDSAKVFVEAYRAAGYRDSFATYGASAFDAANAIISALAKVLPGKTTVHDAGVRRAIIAAVATTNISGVTGPVAFDQFGDNVTRLLTMFAVTDGSFIAKQTEAFGA